MLADWRISSAKFQTKKKPDGTNLDNAQYVVKRTDGTCQRVTLESPTSIGLPTAGDEDFVIAFLALAKDQGFASDIVSFVPSQLLKLMGLSLAQKNFLRLKFALKRLRAVTVTYESVWYSREKRTVEPFLITGILSEAKLVLRRGRPAKTVMPDSYIQWTRNFYESLKEGNLTSLDLDLYFGWKRPGAKHLYRHLNKVWHAGKKPKVYERDLKELACGHLGMTDCKDLKRNFDQIIKEMEGQQYLAELANELRYQKIRPGVWRVRLELHPSHVNHKTPRVGDSGQTKVRPDAETLVRAYHERRFNRKDYAPKRHDLKHAETLLKQGDLKSLLKIMPNVCKSVAASYHDQDFHFGAAVPFFERSLRERTEKEHRLTAEKMQQDKHEAADKASTQKKRERHKQRQEQLVLWNSLSAAEQSRCFDKTVTNAKSEAIRSYLNRRRDLENPPSQVLEVMAAERESSPDKSS